MKGRQDPEAFFRDPNLYTGVAGQKARRLAEDYRRSMDVVASRLKA
jgi:hypothetical protein